MRAVGLDGNTESLSYRQSVGIRNRARTSKLYWFWKMVVIGSVVAILRNWKELSKFL